MTYPVGGATYDYIQRQKDEIIMKSIDKLTTVEEEALKIIKHHQIMSDDLNQQYDEISNLTNQAIVKSEEILKKYNIPLKTIVDSKVSSSTAYEAKNSHLKSWDALVKGANANIDKEISFEDVLTKEEIEKVRHEYAQLNESFNSMHRLDGWDWTIAGVSGVIAALVDILLVQMPKHKGFLGAEGHEGGPLSNWMNDHIHNSMSPEEIAKLERDNWVPYDAAHNKNLNINIDGLNTRTHRIQSFGHDPILGFIFGVKDILNGEFSAIDIHGKFITQAIDLSSHPEMLGMSLFNAIGTVIGHLKSDVATSAGLPAPLMGLLQLIPGEINGHTFTEITRGMYVQGYNFNHFLAMSIPVMIIEVLVRLLYFSKRHWKDGYSIKDSIPFGDKPKLQTMLFSAHTIATAANAGKVYLQANPLAINYPQWIAFFKYSIGQIKWILIDKPNKRFKYIQCEIDNSWIEINTDLDSIINNTNIKPFILK